MSRAHARIIRSPPDAVEDSRNRFSGKERRAAARFHALGAPSDLCRCRSRRRLRAWWRWAQLFAPVQRGGAMPDLPRPTAIALCSWRDGIFRGVYVAESAAAVRALGLVRQNQLGRGTPQAFQIIETPSLFAKHVHDKRAIVQQRPFRTAAAFA